MTFLSASATNTLVAPINFNIVDFIFASVIDLLPTVLELGQLLPLMVSVRAQPYWFLASMMVAVPLPHL